MPRFLLSSLLLCAGTIGCAASNHVATSRSPVVEETTSPEATAGQAAAIQQAAYQQPHAGQHDGHGMGQPTEPAPQLQPGVGKRFLEPPPIPDTPPALRAIEHGETGSPETPLSLEMLESLACSHNPTLMQAKAQVDGAFGKAIQAGLWPNPTIGYMQDQIGVEGTRGEFVGGFVEQKIVTANKLDLSRGKFLERTRAAEWQAMAQEYLVLNDIRIHFFRTLGRQQLVEIHQELLKNSEDHLVTVREMYDYGQATRADVHKANASLQEERLKLLMVENEYRESFETLTALVGIEMAVAPLEGLLAGDLAPIEWDAALARLLSESPELMAAHAKLRADQITLKREKVEPIPNVFVKAAAGHNYEARDDVANVEVFVEVPLFDWNQGTVKQAEADMIRQQAEIRRTELNLRRRLAQVYRQYLTAHQHVENYERVIVPESRKAYESLLDSYEADRVEWPDVLHAQRDYNLRREQWVRNLIAWRENEVLLAGYLLHGGLDAPEGATPPGHIDALPKPR